MAGTILVHLLLLLLLPQVLKQQPPHVAARKVAKPKVFTIQMTPPKVVKALPVPKKYVERANPNANNDVPDRTNNFAARTQKVAQEKPTPNGKSDMPTQAGHCKDIPATQVVNGQPHQAAGDGPSRSRRRCPSRLRRRP